MDNTIKLELDSTQLAEFVAIVKDLANTVGMHGDTIDQQRKIVEEHDAALVMDTQRLDAHEQQIKAARISRATLADQLTAVSEWVTKKLAEQNGVIVDGLDARFREMGMRIEALSGDLEKHDKRLLTDAHLINDINRRIEALAGDVQADRERFRGHAKASANVLEEHDKRLDDCGSALAGFDKRIRKLEWGVDKAPAPDAVKALAKRLDVLDTALNKALIGLSDRLRIVEHPEDHSVRQCGGLCGEPAPTVCGEEPKSVGAVVRDAEGGLWVRADHGKGRPWREVLPGTYDEDDACRRKWGQFTATDVLSFGVDAGSREAAAGFTSAVPGVVHDNLVSQLAIAVGRLDEEDAMGYETVPEFLAGARWLLAVARNARP